MEIHRQLAAVGKHVRIGRSSYLQRSPLGQDTAASLLEPLAAENDATACRKKSLVVLAVYVTSASCA
jgi:hypothetical protein